MRFVDLIEKKAEGRILTDEEIGFMITNYVSGEIPDYQMSSMMMAIRLNGMTNEEIAALTMAMTHSGETFDLSGLPGVKLDKHSTGGVGDTTTLVVAPLVAACGGTVAKMSGRGLGHTGGTIDKLEAIPGTCVEQEYEAFCGIVRRTGLAVIGQSEHLDPADKKMYALRDVTATVKSIPLIASSIMSKKLAAGADAIVLDVKTGSGAFMETPEEARVLARTMVDIGKLVGRKVAAVITDMDQPLGMAVGNALEVREAVQLLSGMIKETDPLYEVCMILGSCMLRLAGITSTNAEARAKLKGAIRDGSGLKKLQAMIDGLGGDSSYLTPERMELLCAVKQKKDLPADGSGFVTDMDALAIGTAAQLLGAGRAVKTDVIDPAVGLIMRVRTGDYVNKGDPLCTFYINDDRELARAEELMRGAVRISEQKDTESRPMLYDVIIDG